MHRIHTKTAFVKREKEKTWRTAMEDPGLEKISEQTLFLLVALKNYNHQDDGSPGI